MGSPASQATLKGPGLLGSRLDGAPRRPTHTLTERLSWDLGNEGRGVVGSQ